MQEKTVKKRLIVKEIWHFIIHLRWHYQVFILSGGFLLGGFLSSTMHWTDFALQFLNVHLLLFGGATAYNSYWDKDKGPIGGLKKPPPMSRWMWAASLLMIAAGQLAAFWFGLFFGTFYLLSAVLFWLYSTPHFRWKGTPLRSLAAIGISTGTNSVLMGAIAAGQPAITTTIWTAAIGVMFMILSLYPVSQLYQLDEDRERGDLTFAIKFGFAGVIQFFGVSFACGVLLVAFSVSMIEFWVGLLFLLLGGITGIWVYYQLKKLTAKKDDYETVMRIKYGTSLAFVAFFLFFLCVKHLDAGIL